jgi:hypothetical protein
MFRESPRDNDLEQPLTSHSHANESGESPASSNETPAKQAPTASFATRWIKPMLASYIVTTGTNIAVPHFFSQTVGRIPVVGDWTAQAMKTAFEHMPTAVLDMLMTSGSLANFNNVKSFFVTEDTTPTSTATKVGNFIAFWGSAALVGYATRMVCVAAGHLPEEGMMLPAAILIPAEYAGMVPESVAVILPNLHLWNQNISALTIAAQTVVTPVVETGVKYVGGKIASVAPYLKQTLFGKSNNTPVVSVVSDDVRADSGYTPITIRTV